MMKILTRFDSSSRKKQNGKIVEDLEQWNTVSEIDHGLVSCKYASTDPEDDYFGKLNNLEEQVLHLKNKLKSQFLLSKPKQECDDDGTTQLQREILKIKAQKVELQRRIKQDAVQLRTFQALHEKEVLQLKKDERKNEYEKQKLLAFNERLKMVVQRKTEEASMATKWLKDLLKSRKDSPCSINDPRLQEINHQIEITQRLNEVYTQSELQLEEGVRMAEEAVREKGEADILIQQSLWRMLQDKEAECEEKDLELKNLNEKVVKLTGLVEELNIITDEINNTKKLESPTPLLSEQVICREAGDGEFDGESSNAGIVSPNAETGLRVCCSCNTKSLCKTIKCACRNNGGFCGISCACSSTRCKNREVVIAKVSSNPLSDIGNIGVAANTAKPIMKRNRRKK